MLILFLFFMSWIQTTFGIFLKAIFFLCQNLFAWSFSGFWVLKNFKVLVYQCLFQIFCLRMCFKARVCWFLSQSSCLPMSISKSYILVCLKAFIYLCLFQSSYLLMCFKILVSMCMSQSSCLPIVCLKALIYFCLCQSFCLLVYVSKLLSTTICLHQFWMIYEFWNSSQAWLTLPYNICKSVSKVMNFQAPQSSFFMCHNLFVGIIIIKVHKRNVSPENHSHDTTLNDHYVYQFIYFGEFIFSFNIHILCDWNGFDCLWFGWFKHLLKCLGTCFRNVVPLRNFIEKESIGIIIFVQIDSYFNQKLNKVCSTWWHKSLVI